MKYQRSVGSHQQGARINLLEFIIHRDLRDDGGRMVGVRIIEQARHHHLVYSMTMTVGEKVFLMVDLHRVRVLHRNEAAGRINLMKR